MARSADETALAERVGSAKLGFFEHSPLSCNGEAKSFEANAHCSFDTLEDAVAAGKVFSKGGYEPGPYYVARVLRRRSPQSRAIPDSSGSTARLDR